VILFGQCAAGANWVDKLTELDPEVFWDQWMNQGKVSSPLRTIFIPHRVFSQAEWEMRARSARLLFDRCRIVAFAHPDTAAGTFADRLLNCCRTEWKLSLLENERSACRFYRLAGRTMSQSKFFAIINSRFFM
jgi:hypothetical protein